MSRVPYIRLATYAVVLACFAFARPVRFFIPLRLPYVGIDTDIFDDPRPFRGGYTPVALPGFADTRMSGSAVTRAAEEAASRDHVRVEQLKNLQITLAIREGKLVWLVDWNIFEEKRPSFEYRVIVDDASGRAWHEDRARYQTLNQSPLPTSTSVTPRPDARVAPAALVAALQR